MTTILVTGGTGFIGRSLLERLRLRTDMDCWAVARQPERLQVPGIHVVQADLSSSESCCEAKRSFPEPEIIVHLAACLPDRPDTPGEVGQQMAHTLWGSLNVLGFAGPRTWGIVYASTVDVYGSPQALPIREDHPTEPETFYGAAKLAAEKFLRIACEEHGMAWTILRLSQVYGPGEPAIKAIPRFVRSIVQGESPQIYGDGSDARDYLNVVDAVGAFLRVVESRRAGLYNIGGGRPRSLTEVAEVLLGLAGRPDLRVVYLPRKRPRRISVLDITHAFHELDWEPRVPLEAGLAKQLEHAMRAAGIGATTQARLGMDRSGNR